MPFDPGVVLLLRGSSTCSSQVHPPGSSSGDEKKNLSLTSQTTTPNYIEEEQLTLKEQGNGSENFSALLSTMLKYSKKQPYSNKSMTTSENKSLPLCETKKACTNVLGTPRFRTLSRTTAARECQGESNLHHIVVTILCRLRPLFPKGNWPFSGTRNPPPFCGKSYYSTGSPVWIRCLPPPGSWGQKGDAKWWPSIRCMFDSLWEWQHLQQTCSSIASPSPFPLSMLQGKLPPPLASPCQTISRKSAETSAASQRPCPGG